MSEPVRFQLKREYIVESLRTAIAEGEFEPGQKLRQEELAARFQISSTPVREALRKLEAEGLVTSVPHQGVYVTRLSAEQIKERYKLRALLESYAAREAVTRLQERPDHREKLLTDLRRQQSALAQARQAGQRAEVVAHNTALHSRLYQEAGSPLLMEMITDLWKYHFPFSALWTVPGRAERAEAEHEELFQAIEAGNAALVEQLTREHIDLSSQLLVEYFESLPVADED